MGRRAMALRRSSVIVSSEPSSILIGAFQGCLKRIRLTLRSAHPLLSSVRKSKPTTPAPHLRDAASSPRACLSLSCTDLLRRAQLDAAVEHGLSRGVIVNKEIAEHNAAALEREGYKALEAVFARLRPAARAADDSPGS